MATKRKGEKEKDLFDGASQLPWDQFFVALNAWFKESAEVKLGLDMHEDYLKQRIGLESESHQVTSEIFYSHINQNGHSFWDWICAIRDYVRKFPQYWESGLLLGFASRLTAEHLLDTAEEPSMVIKFSESRLGKMVVSYVNWIHGRKLIEHIIFEEDDDSGFANKSLVDCVRLSLKLQCVKKILPGNKPIKELFDLEPQRADLERKRCDGYVSAGVAIIWK